jgi:hypothetical protein
MNTKTNQQIWAKKIAQFKKSGKTKEEWCAKKNINRFQLAYWLRQFPEETTATQWLPVEIKQGEAGKMDSEHSRVPASHAVRISQGKNPTSSPITVKIGQATVEVHPGFDKAHLLAVLSILTAL